MDVKTLVSRATGGKPLSRHRHFRPACTRAALTCAVCGKLLELTQDGEDRKALHREDVAHGHAPAPALELLTFRPYDLRHLHASLLLARHVDLKTISERLGHANAGFTLSTYTHAVPGTQEAAAVVIGEELFPADAGSSDIPSDKLSEGGQVEKPGGADANGTPGALTSIRPAARKHPAPRVPPMRVADRANLPNARSH